MKLLIAIFVLAVATCSQQNVFTFTQYNPAGAVPFDQYWETFKTTHSMYSGQLTILKHEIEL